MQFAVSTTAFRKMPIEGVLAIAEEHGLSLEFSSGLPYRDDLKQIFLNARVARLPHNYFPAPREPFVLNLASLDVSTRQKSIEHSIQGLELARAAGASFYSIHAGFCLDPSPSELGKKISLVNLAPREMHWRQFLNSLEVVLAAASNFGVKLLVENNVVAAMNLADDGSAPFLCYDAEEIEALMSRFSNTHLGILLDTGHLKVSAQTMGFSAADAVERMKPFIGAIHHSDNDGTQDTNNSLGADYWFLRYMPWFGACSHILEVHDQSLEDIKRQENLLSEAVGRGAA